MEQSRDESCKPRDSFCYRSWRNRRGTRRGLFLGLRRGFGSDEAGAWVAAAAGVG